jgi:uncharacterized protein YcbX
MATGTLASVWRFPVKSFQGESPESVELGPLGIEGDRRWGLRDLGSGSILSAKKAGIGDRLLDWSAVTEGDDVRVDVDGESFLVSTDRDAIGTRCSELLGTDVRLDPATTDEELYESYWPEMDGLALSDVTVEFPLAMMTEKGTFVDLAGLHFVTSSSLRHLQRLAPDSRIEVDRFRPSFVIDLPEDVDGFVENDWQNRSARLGDAELALTGASPRCVMTTKAQKGLPRDLDVLKTLARENRIEQEGLGNFACLGIYAEVTRPGRITVGDTFELL